MPPRGVKSDTKRARQYEQGSVLRAARGPLFGNCPAQRQEVLTPAAAQVGVSISPLARRIFSIAARRRRETCI
jgi:hypothetical protein